MVKAKAYKKQIKHEGADGATKKVSVGTRTQNIFHMRPVPETSKNAVKQQQHLKSDARDVLQAAIVPATPNSKLLVVRRCFSPSVGMAFSLRDLQLLSPTR